MVAVAPATLARPSQAAQAAAETPQRLIERGQAALDASRFDEAEAAFSTLVALRPSDAVAQFHLGMTRAMAGKPAAAIAPLRAALKLRPDLAPAQLFLGISYLEIGRPADAVAPLRQVVQADPKNPNARQALAEALVSTEQFGDAATHLHVLVAAQPESPQAWAALGRSYEGVARQAFTKLQAIGPDAPYIWLLVADVLSVEEKHAQAFALIKKAQTALPTLPGLHHTLARVYQASGHADWAAVEQQKADAERPPCATVPVACAYLAGRFEDTLARTQSASQATALYWRARAANDLAAASFAKLESLPPSVERYVVRAGIFRDQGQVIEAAAQLREALTLAPGNPALERDLAGALYAARDYDAVLPLLEKLHTQTPDTPELLVALGDTLLQSQQTERAIAVLTQAVEKDGSLLLAHAALGRALMQAGEAAKAAPHLERALTIDEDGSLHYQLAQAMQRTGQSARAKSLLEEYQRRSRAVAPVPAASAPAEITPPVP